MEALMSRSINRRSFVGSLMLGATALAGRSQVGRPTGSSDHSGGAPMTEIDFIDERWVEHTYFLSRKVTQPERFLPEPTIRTNPAQSSGTVLPAEQGIVMWYGSPYRAEIPGGPLWWHYTRYAVSADGHTFDQPSLGLREHEGTRDNNLVLAPGDMDDQGRPLNGPGGCSGFCVLDASLGPVPHARGRYTALFNARLPERPGGLCLAHSDDGLRWHAYPENPVRPGSSDTYNNFFFDERLGRYVAYIRPNVHAGPSRVNRLVARIESDDMLHWGSQQVVLDTDDRDAPPQRAINLAKDALGYPRGRDRQFYGLTVTPHQDLYLGFASFYDAASGHMWCELAHSYDGADWRREATREPFIPIGPEGAWDSGMAVFIAAGCPASVGDYWYVYYTGTNFDHHHRIHAMEDKGDIRMVGAVRLKRGRLVGYHTGSPGQAPQAGEGAREVPPDWVDRGDLLTRAFELNGSALFVNADARSGAVAIEICDAEGKPLPGFSREEAVPIQEDAVRAPVRFRGAQSVASLHGRPVRLRVHLTRASVYGLAFG